MKKDLTEIIFILDRSGSMSNLEKDTIGGYNAFLESQRLASGDAKVTTVLFDDKYEILHNGVAIREVMPITGKEYFARGYTALLDAVGKTINEVGERLKNTDECERPEKVIVVITTDGQENASKSFSYDQIRQIITHQQEKYGWEFLFLGANIDAVAEAQNLGIQANRSMKYAATVIGTQLLYSSVANAISTYRSAGTIDVDWGKDIGSSCKK